MDSISDNIEDIYICNDNLGHHSNNMETFGKYIQDGGFLFNDITENIIGPLEKKSCKTKIDFDSNCMNIGMTVSIKDGDDDYLHVEYEQSEIIKKIKERVIDNFIDDVYNHELTKNIEPTKKETKIEEIPDTIFSNLSISHCVTDHVNNSIKLIDNQQLATTVTTVTEVATVTKDEYTGDIIIDINSLPDETPNSFFNCHNEENSVNNVIAYKNKDNYHINELATTCYMFDNEDLKTKDIYPFTTGQYNYKKTEKPRGWFESIGIAATSAMMILSQK